MNTFKNISVPMFLVLTFGFALSAVIAYLFATEQGHDLRVQIARRTGELASNARHALPKVKEVVRDVRQAAAGTERALNNGDER
jgi:hypothetical protein